MLFCGLLIEMVIRQSDHIACLPAWAEDGQEVPKNIYLLSFDSSVTEWSVFCGFGLPFDILALWPKDKVPASGAGDCRLESCQGQISFTYPASLYYAPNHYCMCVSLYIYWI